MGSAELNASIVRRIFDAFASRNAAALHSFFADDATWTVPGEGTMAGTAQGKEEIFRFLGRLPRETAGTYGSQLIDVLASEHRAAALYRAYGERGDNTLDIEQLLPFRIQDGLVHEVLALPCDPIAFETFWRRDDAHGESPVLRVAGWGWVRVASATRDALV